MWSLNFKILCIFMCKIIFISSHTMDGDDVLPTLYEYYTAAGITEGLNADKINFTLNTFNISLYSGTIHYFRVPRAYWRDRLRKARAAGLNTVETYVAWNLHEPEPGKYDFGDGGTDMQDLLHLVEFLKIAQEEDLLAILRPGPFICAEWEFGGMPSWLLREEGIKVRTSDPLFMSAVRRYYNKLIPLLAPLQFTRGGPVIAFQIENEYGSVKVNNQVDREYLLQLKDLLENNGIVELLVTSDAPSYAGDVASVPGALQTANFGGYPDDEFKALEKLQPGKPLMAMEFWSGWFDHWSENHHVTSPSSFADIYERILKYPASVNMYMFHGGTDFGFMNGANMKDSSVDNAGYQPDTSSYDYDAPLNEAGDYTPKYEHVVRLINKYNLVKTRLPQRPSESVKVAYPSVPITQYMYLSELIDQVHEKIDSENVISMENLPINNGSGQSYGYTLYRKKGLTVSNNSVLTIEGRICDTIVVVLDGKLCSKPLEKNKDLDGFGYWRLKNSKLTLPYSSLNGTLDLLVENWGRNNFGSLKQFNQKKGLWQGDVYLNSDKLLNWEIIPLQFRRNWIQSLVNWKDGNSLNGPVAYKAKLNITEPKDTYIDMREWGKGFVAVNGFILGRYATIGPQYTLYFPAPFQKVGENEIFIFEHFKPGLEVKFSEKQIFSK